MNFSVQQSSESHRSIFDDIERAIQAHPLGIDHHHHEEIYTRVYQITDLNNLSCNVGESNCRALTESIRKDSYSYARGTLTVNFSSPVNPEIAIYATVVHPVEKKKIVQEGYCRVMVNSHHWRSCIKILRNENGMKCASAPLRMCCALGVDNKSIFPSQEFKLGKIANVSTKIVQPEPKFTDTMQSCWATCQRLKVALA